MSRIKHKYCECDTCVQLRKVMKLLEAISNSPFMMGGRDIERLGDAMDLLSGECGLDYDEATERYATKREQDVIE